MHEHALRSVCGHIHTLECTRTQRERERQTDRQTDRDTETETDRETQRQTETERKRDQTTFQAKRSIV